ncbi:PREDICTED: U-box domain-containing protein 5-like isoform X1 [Prunus mume]|uniref:RING-type E3 ubiquitin transferase n=2 Tax=Prunus mume TaxID=102107 RepID=A0ABM1LWS1_PRUMU|nr:PREDICTED: U-box domain-containing protein 5-like isoform X1 [Prunus mume]
MGTDAAEGVETVRKPHSFKVHRLMCTELMKLVDRISRIFPDIEAARPRCTTGIQALCLLTRAIEKAKLLLQHCSDSSKLYLAFTGDVIVSRCQRSRNLLEQNLREIQNWVPVMLVAEISQIVDDLKDATFILDPSEEEAGRVVRGLLHQDASQSNSREDSEIKALQIASWRLHITSSKAMLIEKRSIKKLLDKVGDSDLRKKQILTYFLYLIKKYGHLIMGKQAEGASMWQQGSLASDTSGNGLEYNQYAEAEPHVKYNQYNRSDMLHRTVPPEEFLCGISSRLMYDPVVIASGQTYEKKWIQKWFDEGHDTCPKTHRKLTHLSFTPNVAMKELISRWCTECGVTIPDPSMQPETLSWETSSTSIASLGSSMNDIHLQMDLSNVSFGSLDTSYNSDSSRTKIESGLSLVQEYDDSLKYGYAKNCETDLEFLSKLGELPWESQCKVVKDVKSHLKCNPQASYSMSSKNFVNPLIKFLRDAHDLDDVKAQRDGFKLMFNFVSKNRNDIPYLHEEAYTLLASYLDSEVIEVVLAILEIVSVQQHCRSNISESGALSSILKLLDSQIKDIQEKAIKVLYNLSLNRDICPKIVSLECIPKLVSFFKDDALAGNCISILKNLCDTEEARISIAETSGCIASIAEVLETGSSEDQEHAVAILLSLCSQRVEFCHLVMHEGVIPPLVFLSNNGKERAMISALEVLRLLRDIDYVDEQECSGSDLDASKDNDNHSAGKKLSKTSGFFGRSMFKFSKTSSLAPKKKK